jgi:SAM-dependent methyltransferase
VTLNYDENYTYIFHTPGIEPWVAGFLKNKSPKSVIDIGCGLGFSAVLLRSYIGYSGYLVGLDIIADKVLKAKKLGLYDDLVVGDATKPPFRTEAFDALISLEVFHQLSGEALASNQETVKKSGSVILALPYLPTGISIKDLINRGYYLYKCLLRGLVLVDIRSYKILLVRSSLLFRTIKAILILLMPLLRLVGILKKGYLLAFLS